MLVCHYVSDFGQDDEKCVCKVFLHPLLGRNIAFFNVDKTSKNK